MTPTGTSTPKTSRSRLENVSADSESPPRSMKCDVGIDFGVRRAQQRLGGLTRRCRHGLVRSGVAQCAQLVDAGGREVGVELLESLRRSAP